MSKQDLYSFFTKAGMTHAGTLGLLGNLQAESGCESCRLQGDFDMSRSRSKAYAAKVDSGEMSVHIFARDAQGWGLAQFTYWSRKESLYYYCRGRGASIADETSQAAFIVKEMQEGYPQLWKFLCSTDEMFTATKRVCEEYERPAINNVQARYAMALAIEKELQQKEKVVSSFWPPRRLEKGMSGPDVEVLQTILKARGYAINYISGKFDNVTENAVNAFKADNSLGVPGVVGSKTWAKALERG